MSLVAATVAKAATEADLYAALVAFLLPVAAFGHVVHTVEHYVEYRY